MYVPSYVGIDENAKVDEYAKSVENPTLYFISQTLMTPKIILNQIHRSKWQDFRNSETDNKLFLHKKTVLP